MQTPEARSRPRRSADILPTHPIIRLLANIESVIGQLYMAVLVAILITGYASSLRTE